MLVLFGLVLGSFLGNLFLNCCCVLKESEAEAHVPTMNTLRDIDTNSTEAFVFSRLSLDPILVLQSE